MPVTAKLNYLRIPARKVRLVADLIRGKTVEEAQIILNFTVKKAAKDLMGLLKSAITSGRNNFQLEESNLYISKILVDEGPKYKRWMPRARGQASEIQKKTSHVTIVLDEIVRKPKKVKRAKKVEKIEKVPKVEKEIKEKPKPEIEGVVGGWRPKPKLEKGIRRISVLFHPALRSGIRRIFRRKAF